MVAAGAKSTAVLTSDAEIVPYARARLTAALETVPHAPRARWRWVAVHRCPRAIAKATCRALTPKVPRRTPCALDARRGAAKTRRSPSAVQMPSPTVTRGAPRPPTGGPSQAIATHLAQAERGAWRPRRLGAPRLRRAAPAAGWARRVEGGQAARRQDACHGPLPDLPLARVPHCTLADNAALSSLALQPSHSFWAYDSRCSHAAAHPLPLRGLHN